MNQNELLKKIPTEFFISMLILIVFFVFVDLYQYSTTEIWWVQNSIHFDKATLFILLLIFILPLATWKWFNKNLQSKYFVFFLFILVTITHKAYSNFYDQLQKYPRIKNISKTWGIPGSWVKITGKNFGEPWQPGNIYLGETKMIIKKWDDKEVIFEIPINIKKDKQTLKVINMYEKSQKEYFEFNINDPNEKLL